MTRRLTDTELDVRLSNIEDMLKQVLLHVEASAPPPEVRPGSAMIPAIARELVYAPDLYTHKRRMRANG